MSTSSLETAKGLLEKLRSGHPWKNAFVVAREAEDGDRDSDWDDGLLISIYQECLLHGLTFQASPEEFLEACKRLSRLLFRYGRAREANNYLLQLRDLSPDPSSIPAWAWAYSAKLAYLEDIDYCIRKPGEVLDYIERAVSVNVSSPQAPAVLTDFINSAAKHLTEHSNPEAANGLADSIRKFLEHSPLTDPQPINHALRRLDQLVEQPDATEAEDLETEDTTRLLWQREVDQLRTQLEQTEAEAETLAAEKAALDKENQELLLELHLLRDQSEQEATSISTLASLIDRLDAQLEQLRTEWQNSQHAVPAHPQPATPLPTRSRIIVVGESRAAEVHLLGICKAMGLEKDQVDFRLSYKAFDSLDIGTLQYNDSVAGILIGPVPHKVPGQDDPVQALMRGEGYPPTIRVESSSGELKITKSSFREALETLLTRIASVEPSLH